MKTRTTILLTAAAVLVAAPAWTQVLDRGKPIPWPQETEWAQLNVHDHGIGVRVRNGDLSGGTNKPRQVQIIDLGPGIPNMKADIEPVSARISVNGYGSLPFFVNADGILEALVPAAWLEFADDNDVSIDAWGPEGERILDLSGLFPASF